jgi:hypothetical protein
MCKRKSFFGAVVVMVVVVVVGEYRAKKGRDDDGRSQKRFHGQSPPVSVALLGKRRCPCVVIARCVRAEMIDNIDA